MGLGRENLKANSAVSYLLCLIGNNTLPSIVPIVVRHLPVSILKEKGLAGTRRVICNWALCIKFSTQESTEMTLKKAV